MKDKVDAARRFSEKLIHLPDKELEIFASIFERREIHKGEMLLKEGEIAKDIIFLESGILRQFYYKEGRDVTEHFACGGQGIMCIVSLFTKTGTELMVEALENGVIYLIPYSELIKLSEQYSLLAIFLRKMFESSLILSQEKADSWRFEKAKERYNRFLKEYPEVAKYAPVNHIASYLLMTPESLSRVRAGAL